MKYRQLFLIGINLLSLFFLPGVKSVNAASMQLVFDGDFHSALPLNFRSTQQAIANPAINQQGLNTLNILGSAEFTGQQLQNIIKQIPGPIIVVDLRQESHGFINELPVSWYEPHNAANLGLSAIQIKLKEAQELTNIKINSPIVIKEILRKTDDGDILQTRPIKLKVKSVLSEVALVHRYNLAYARFYVTDFHAPAAEEVDRFIAFMKSQPKNSWLYFHCREGRGRTTTFMVMADIMQNAKQVPLNDIIQRQKILGGVDLFLLPDKKAYKYPWIVERKNFIKKFYKYAKNNQDGYDTNWTAWLQDNPDNT